MEDAKQTLGKINQAVLEVELHSAQQLIGIHIMHKIMCNLLLYSISNQTWNNKNLIQYVQFTVMINWSPGYLRLWSVSNQKHMSMAKFYVSLLNVNNNTLLQY